MFLNSLISAFCCCFVQYLWANGAKRFFQWFDYMVWYPLGRPVGTTIYPGMQFTSVWIKQYLLPEWSINDICCFVPAWFGVLATLSTSALCYVSVNSVRATKGSKSLLTDIPLVSQVTNFLLLPIKRVLEKLLVTVTGSNWGMASQTNPPALESAVFTAMIMSIVPAHLLRSVGGGYDNESVATTAMQLTFWFWTWTLSSANVNRAIVLGIIAGFMYFYMVAAWGGYVFVINLVGVHAFAVFLFRKVPFEHLYYSYTSFYVVGTTLAMQIPVVGWMPLKSLEQLGPFGVFAGLQALQLMRVLEQNYKKVNKWKIRGLVVLGGIVVSLPVLYWLYTRGYFGPISSRVRGLFVKHTKTGNPLVDSVAEHQAASAQAYYQYLNIVCYLAPVGYAIVAVIACSPASSFLLVYGVCAYFFSLKMVRLILLAAPIASICGGIALGYCWAWSIGGIFGNHRPNLALLLLEPEVEDSGDAKTSEPVVGTEKNKSKKKAISKKKDVASASTKTKIYDPLWVRGIRLAVGLYALYQAKPIAEQFKEMCHQVAKQISHPTIISKGTNRQTGEQVLVDDYREAYFWLKENTPDDARIMAWWDYGYQITGIGNRTTIADGNTWNHEHIALLGRILTGPEKESHRIARHLADYVLVWAGGGGDDVAKSPHLKRIANSVYRGLCSEPTCRSFTMRVSRVLWSEVVLLVSCTNLDSNFFQPQRGNEPSKQLSESLLYKLHSNGLVPGVHADSNRWKEVFRSKYGKVRIYKILSVSNESKDWVKNNRVCDAPGSWYCPGQYPPALEKILTEKRDFAQLEDFNRKVTDEEYQKQYFENLKYVSLLS
jgi:dolichyl-diphosphooligosaccharide---protein glycosyltransferase